MVPDKKRGKVLTALLNCIIEDHDYHLDTGIVGTRYLWDVLSENGHANVAYKIVTQNSYPGYGYMIKEGATTLWERWEKLEGKGMNSHNHIMLGSVDTWFFKALTGINSIEPGWRKIKIKPFIPTDVEYSSASLNTIKGVVYCSWEKDYDSLRLVIEIPVGCIAEIWIPIERLESSISEGGKLLWKNGELIDKVKDIVYNTMIEKFTIFNIGSGYYKFNIQNN
jgi:alpha-L-rhamnosidase